MLNDGLARLAYSMLMHSGSAFKKISVWLTLLACLALSGCMAAKALPYDLANLPAGSEDVSAEVLAELTSADGGQADFTSGSGNGEVLSGVGVSVKYFRDLTTRFYCSGSDPFYARTIQVRYSIQQITGISYVTSNCQGSSQVRISIPVDFPFPDTITYEGNLYTRLF